METLLGVLNKKGKPHEEEVKTRKDGLHLRQDREGGQMSGPKKGYATDNPGRRSLGLGLL